MKNVILVLSCLFLITSCSDAYKTSDEGVLVPPTVMEDASLSAININGVRLHSEAFGDSENPMIVVLHGGPGADYRSQLNFRDLVQDGYYVVFYDQRGSGLSERLGPEGFPTVQTYVDELDEVINYYQQSMEQKVILAGHSWGAMLATAYVDQNPNEIDGIILGEPGGFTWEQTEAYISRSRALKLGEEATNDFVYQDQFITGDDHNTLDYKMALSLAGDVNTGDIAPPSFWRYGAVCSSSSIDLAINNPDQMDFTKNLKLHETKVLFAYSELNPSYGKDHAELVAVSYANVELVEIMDCGHEIPEFGWSNFYPLVKAYLEEVL